LDKTSLTYIKGLKEDQEEWGFWLRTTWLTHIERLEDFDFEGILWIKLRREQKEDIYSASAISLQVATVE